MIILSNVFSSNCCRYHGDSAEDSHCISFGQMLSSRFYVFAFRILLPQLRNRISAFQRPLHLLIVYAADLYFHGESNFYEQLSSVFRLESLPSHISEPFINYGTHFKKTFSHTFFIVLFQNRIRSKPFFHHFKTSPHRHRRIASSSPIPFCWRRDLTFRSSC